ncbi:MAG: hypothetical protein LUQ07_03025 [Methanospirillum sp.]|nr:hypothetical protein [Methanospirillum sp.]
MTEKTDAIVKIPELPVIEIVDDLVQVYKEYMVVNAALKRDFFSWLAKNGPATPEQISEGTGIRQEFIPSLLATLYYLDLVRKSGDTFSVSPAASMNFVRSSPFYQGDYLMKFPMDDSPWFVLDEYLTNPDHKTTFDTTSYASVRALAEYSLRGTIQNITNVTKTWMNFSASRNYLEMGGGHGLYAIAACQNNPDLEAAVLTGLADSRVAEEYICRFGMQERIKVLNGDICDHPLSGYDIVLLSHSLYPYTARLDEMIQRTASLLSTGGLFISNHWFAAPPAGTGMQGLYELELALHNRYHQLPDKQFFEALCSKHHLEITRTGVTRSQYGESSIHMAEKKDTLSTGV